MQEQGELVTIGQSSEEQEIFMRKFDERMESRKKEKMEGKR